MANILNKFTALKNFIKENPNFEIRSGNVFCNLCNKIFEYILHEGITQSKKHMNSKLHVTSTINSRNKKQGILNFERTEMKSFSEFNKDLVEAFCSSNIPIKKNEKLKRFFEKYCKYTSKSESYYRKFVIDSLFKENLTHVTINTE